MFKFMCDFFFCIFVKKSTASPSIPLSRLEILESHFDETLLQLGGQITKGPFYVLFHFREYKSVLRELDICRVLVDEELAFLSQNPASLPDSGFNWGFMLGTITVLLLLLSFLISCTLPGSFVPVAAKASQISTALVVYVSTAGTPASGQAQLLGLLKFLELAIQSCDWGLALFYANQIIRILTRLDVDPVSLSSASGLLGN